MKLHEDKEFLKECVNNGANSRDIARACKVSIHLVEIQLRRHGIKYTPWSKQKNGSQ